MGSPSFLVCSGGGRGGGTPDLGVRPVNRVWIGSFRRRRFGGGGAGVWNLEASAPAPSRRRLRRRRGASGSFVWLVLLTRPVWLCGSAWFRRLVAGIGGVAGFSSDLVWCFAASLALLFSCVSCLPSDAAVVDWWPVVPGEPPRPMFFLPASDPVSRGGWILRYSKPLWQRLLQARRQLLGCRSLSPAVSSELEGEDVMKRMEDLQLAPCVDFVVFFIFCRDLSVSSGTVILNLFQI